MNEEEEIIKEGIKSHDKKDTLCYVGIAVLAIMIFIPPIFRVIFADSIPQSTIQEIVYMDVTCRTAFFDSEGKAVTEIITAQYRQNEILNMKVEFLYDNKEPKFNEASLLEFEELSKSVKEFKMNKSKDKVVFSIDFLKNPKVKTKEEFRNYTKLAPAQMNYYKTNKGLSCDHESETKVEDTRIWDKEHGIESN